MLLSVREVDRLATPNGGLPKWPKGADCNLLAFAFEGSNPSPAIP